MNRQAIGNGYGARGEVADAVARHPAFTIEEFCTAHRISRTHLFNMMKAGKGPRIMRIGRRVLISTEAAADWRRQLEEESAVAA